MGIEFYCEACEQVVDLMDCELHMDAAVYYDIEVDIVDGSIHLYSYGVQEGSTYTLFHQTPDGNGRCDWEPEEFNKTFWLATRHTFPTTPEHA